MVTSSGRSRTRWRSPGSRFVRRRWSGSRPGGSSSGLPLPMRWGLAVAIRKEGGLFPGAKLERVAQPDYRGFEQRLRLRRDGLSDSDRVVLIDDWCERGSQALAAK